MHQPQLFFCVAAAGDAEYIKLYPVHVLQVAVQVVTAKDCMAAGIGGAHAAFQYADVLL